RVKDTRHACAASREPDIAGAGKGQAGVAGRECAFTGQSRRKRFGLHLLPGHTAIVSSEQKKVAANRITEHNAVLRVPKGNRVKENAGRLLLKDLRPQLAAVASAVDVRLAFLRRAGADDDRSL